MRPRPTFAGNVFPKNDSAVKPTLSSETARLLFALLDAADEDGLLRGCAREERWREVKQRSGASSYHAEGALFWELLEELDRAGKLDGTWMQERWHAARSQSGG